MNKKLILGLVVAGALYYQFGRKKDEAEATESNQGSPIISNNDIFVQYNNKILADKNGYWMLVKNGKIYTFLDLPQMNNWQKQNPADAQPIILDEDIWLNLAHSAPEVFAGQYKG